MESRTIQPITRHTQKPQQRVQRQRTQQRSRSKGAEAKLSYFDYNLLVVIIFLIGFGLVMLYSSSAYEAQDTFGNSMHYLFRQGIISVLAFVVMLLVAKVDYHLYAAYSKELFWFSILIMALVQTPLGVTVNGAKRWLPLPMGFSFQPSELAKIAVILYIPYLICKMGSKAAKREGWVRLATYGLISAGAVFFLTDNLSTAIIVMGITCIMIFVIYPKTKPFAIIIGVGAAVLFVGIQLLSMSLASSDNFRLQRILVWLKPESFSDTYGYQVMQGLYAIGSGGFFGKGLGNSTQKLGVIPEVQNDMILTIICEELGVFGAIVVVVLFVMLLYRLLFIAKNAPDLYGSLIATGIFAHISLQVILNIAVVINLIPTTGVTLPFISYGGTSVLFLMIEMGIALGISRKIKINEK